MALCRAVMSDDHCEAAALTDPGRAGTCVDTASGAVGKQRALVR
jgi:hypothetical protein